MPAGALLEKEAVQSDVKRKEPSVARNVVLYLLFFFLPLIAGSLFLYYSNRSDTYALYGSPKEKERFFRIYGKTFNLIFIGDSRTYCGIHPDLMNKELGTNSVNMAAFAHWFPTQYPYYQDMVRKISPEATVVWTIGHQNFTTSGTIHNRYPVKLKNLPNYLLWGYPIESIAGNLIHFNPLTQIVALREEMHTQLFNFLNAPRIQFPVPNSIDSNDGSISRRAAGAPAVGQSESEDFEQAEGLSSRTAATAGAPAARRLISEQAERDEMKKREAELEAQYKKDPNVFRVEFPEEEGKLRSVILHRALGSYYRVVLDPTFFRGKQDANRASHKPTAADWKFTAEPAYWNTFENILKLFKENHINLVVNEIEEAPNNYADALHRERCRQFMHEKVEPYVQKMGFPYVKVDMSSFGDDDYFDYNHLNSKGGDRYDKMLAEKLRPYLRRN